VHDTVTHRGDSAASQCATAAPGEEELDRALMVEWCIPATFGDHAIGAARNEALTATDPVNLCPQKWNGRIVIDENGTFEARRPGV